MVGKNRHLVTSIYQQITEDVIEPGPQSPFSLGEPRKSLLPGHNPLTPGGREAPPNW